MRVRAVGLSALWAMATDGDAPCDFRVTVQPAGLLFVDESLSGEFQEGSTFTQMVATGEYHLEVTVEVAPRETQFARGRWPSTALSPDMCLKRRLT